MNKNIGLNIFTGVVVAAVVAVAGIGFYLSGTPNAARARKLDEQRVNQLQQISYAVQNYYSAKGALPVTLDDVKNQQFAYIESATDPITKGAYAYRVTSSTGYELCATFQTDNAKERASFGNTWRHSIGNTCFSRQANSAPSIPAPKYVD